MIHGLAGSGALMLLVLSTISSPLIGMSYILIFGIGSVLNSVHDSHHHRIRGVTTARTTKTTKSLRARYEGAKTGNRNELRANRARGNCEECCFLLCWLVGRT